MQAHDVILAATDAPGSGNLAFLLAVAAFVLSLIALVRVSSLKQEPKQSGPAANPQPAPTPAPAPSPAARTAAPSSSDQASNAIPPEIIAVIAAAVAAISGNQAIRIVSIKPMSTSWERAGRQSVLTSHRIR